MKRWRWRRSADSPGPARDNGVLARTLGHAGGRLRNLSSVLLEADRARDADAVSRSLFERPDRVHVFAHGRGGSGGAFSATDPRRTRPAREALVPIILDGENAWEWYEANGRPFLRELYAPHFGRSAIGGADRFRGAGEVRGAAVAGDFSRFVDQREFRCLDRRGGRQSGVGISAGRAAGLRRRARRAGGDRERWLTKNC